MLNRLGSDAKDRALFLQGILITVAVLTLPLVSLEFIWLQFFVPLPVFYYLSIRGSKQGSNIIAVGILLAGAVALARSGLAGLLFSAAMLPTGVVLAVVRKNKQPPQQAAIYGCLALICGWAIWALLFGIMSNTNPFHSLIVGLEEGLNATYQALQETSEVPPDKLLEIETAFTQLKALAPKILPGLLMTSIISTACLNLIVGQWLIRRKDSSLVSWEPFARWQLPEHLVFGLIGAGFMLIFPVAIIKTAGLNLLFVFACIYFFQGLAILTSFLEKWSVPMALKILVYFLVVVQAYGIVMLVITGVADIWADFRKLKAIPPKGDE